jgi:hypothetical protein
MAVPDSLQDAAALVEDICQRLQRGLMGTQSRQGHCGECSDGDAERGVRQPAGSPPPPPACLPPLPPALDSEGGGTQIDASAPGSGAASAHSCGMRRGNGNALDAPAPQSVVIHCRAGVGRAGMIAACVLLRLGAATSAGDAIAQVRQAGHDRQNRKGRPSRVACFACQHK